MKRFFAILLLALTYASFAFADGAAVPAGSAPAGAGSPAQPGMFQMALPFLLMFGVVWFLMIRPQQRRLKDQQQMLSQLKTGDEVLTSSGILGTVTGMTDKVVTLEVADKVRIKMLKSQVSQVVKGNLKDVAT